MNVSFDPVNETAFSPLPNDQPLRRRIRAELLEIQEEFERNGSNEPNADLLTEWHKNFWESLNHHDLEVVIAKFLQKIETIFENPFRPGSFTPRLFGEEPSSLVQFVVAKMRNRNSLLYSARLDAVAAPSNLLPRISDIQERSLNTPELTNFQNLKERLIKKRQEQQERFRRIEQKVQELETIGQEIQVTREEISHFNQTVENLEKETLEHKEAVQKLESELADVKQDTNELEKQNLELDKRCHQVDAAIKDRKRKILSSLGYAAISICASVALNYFLPGSSAVLFKGGGMLGMAKPF